MLELFAKYNLISASEKYEKGYRYGHGKALAVIRPKTTAEVSEILAICNKHKIAVVPQGGNTGLVGASTPDSSGKQIVLSTELLNTDIFDLKNQQVRVGAGVVLDALNSKLADSGLSLPIDIGSSGTCNIGGIIATNAAGTRSGRYGNAKSRVVEYTAVLADGEVCHVERSAAQSKHPRYKDPSTSAEEAYAQDDNLQQDNSRIDPANPFIGSQGWLGVITEAVMQLEPLAQKSDSIVLVPKDDAAINIILERLQQTFGAGLTAFEGMSDNALRLVAKNIPNSRYLFENEPIEQDYALLVEVSSSDKNEDLQGRLLDILTQLMQDGNVVTGLQGKAEIYWHTRHHISESIAKEGEVIATDIAVRGRQNLARFRRQMTDKLLAKYPELLIVPFGHEMIGAAHYNMVWKGGKLSQEDKRNIQAMVYDTVVNQYHGTYSAEHGIGPHNQWAYDKYTPAADKQTAAELKRKFDINGIMNPNVGY